MPCTCKSPAGSTQYNHIHAGLCDDEIDDDFTDEQFLHPSQNTRRKPSPSSVLADSTLGYGENSRSNLSIDSVTTIAAADDSEKVPSSSYDSMCQISSFSDLRRRIRIRKEHCKEDNTHTDNAPVAQANVLTTDESSLEATQLLFEPAKTEEGNAGKSINPSSLLLNKDEDRPWEEEMAEFDPDEEHDMPMFEFESYDRQLTSSDELVSPMIAKEESISYLKASLERRLAKHAWIEEEMAQMQIRYAKMGLKRVRSSTRIRRTKDRIKAKLADRV